MKTKTNTKNSLAETELASPQARAERLKRLRNLANLSRKELCETSDMNINTYKGWELARFGGLPIDGAEKIIRTITKAGVICSLEWLLYGTTPSPSLIEESENSNITELTPVEREFGVFQNTYKQAILEKVPDDCLLPNIKKGDFVAGVKKYGNDIDLILDQLCIIQTLDGKKLIRYLKRGESQGHYSLLCANPSSNALDLVILNTKLLYAAPVSRHYIINNFD
ncbi:MAG: hypothetical protein H0U75_09085 [Legionella sp.]|nr:hypothetical protein [Legionella sp.]